MLNNLVPKLIVMRIKSKISFNPSIGTDIVRV